jgi:hypothetical protein
MNYIETRGIWEVVPVKKCWDNLGRGPTSGRWVDVKKGDDVRSRYVGRDFKPKGDGPNAEIFASMPPLEAKKILFSMAASQQGSVRKKKLLFVDVKKAHMNAICKEWAFVELPEELHRDGYCAQLKYWLYGMRPAARAWEEEYSGKLEEKGYSRGRSVPTVFYNKEKDMSGAVHGDDFTFLGYEEDLLDLIELLKGWFELKVRAILGPDDKDDKEKPKKGDAKDDAKDDGSKKAKKSTKKSTKEPVDTPPVDFDKNMKNFLSENSDNDELMGSLQKDAKALMKNQEQLMNMLHTTGPMLKSSMDMVKSFKGMFGSA